MCVYVCVCCTLTDVFTVASPHNFTQFTIHLNITRPSTSWSPKSEVHKVNFIDVSFRCFPSGKFCSQRYVTETIREGNSEENRYRMPLRGWKCGTLSAAFHNAGN